MARKKKESESTNIIATYSLESIAKLLLKQEGINEGHYLAAVMPNITGGQLKAKEDKNITQGLVIIFDNIRLIKVDEDTPNAIDASKLD